ncbi:UROD/MetE-like protein [Acaromyces ingoldii]|uniref:UROD/MetE-like protein n=1 Tax=Acaromyces ingoldii TaxID=215250 RepID=A0A316YPV3_9BASI|nr:UROD/MetE-like protein [Acaromyces ingoldii]PWN90688.1 UROD/MetE-like protein [Acaromyces ingoldii]
MPGRVDNVPFARAQHIGSLLRPTKLLDVRMRYENGEADYKTELKPVEDEAISDIIQLQRSVGLKCLSDGEFRRHMFCDGFHEHLDGFESVVNPPRSIFKMYVPDVRAFVDSHAKRMAPTWICKGTIKRKNSPSPYEEQFKSMLQFTTPDEIKHIKMTTAAPEWYHLRHSSEFAFTKDAYPEDGEVGYFRDIAAAYREELKALYGLGCRNVQVDDPLLAYFCDESMIKGMKDEGMDPEAELTKYIDLYNQCFAGRPKDMMVGVHLCRGNFKDGMHFSEGGYDRIARRLFNELDADVYYLEYDTERAGTFEPLAEMPADKLVVLGVISSKVGELESPEAMEAKVRSAAKIMAKAVGQSEQEALNRLAVSPQCGFASHSEGNNIALEDMTRKLGLVKQVAKKIWPNDE